VNVLVRGIPEGVKARLVEMAAREHISLNALIVRQLEMFSRFADNARLLDDLPDLDVPTQVINEAIREGRDGR
jgi:hypothetical protein